MLYFVGTLGTVGTWRYIQEETVPALIFVLVLPPSSGTVICFPDPPTSDQRGSSCRFCALWCENLLLS